MTPDKKQFNRVLVVDDDPASLYLAQFAVEDTGVARQVTTRQSAQAGLDFVKAHCLDAHAASAECPDLILLDINMPGMDGFDFLKALQVLGQQHLIRQVVVVLTSSTSPKDQDRMRDLGVRGLMTKPVTAEKIVGLAAKGA